MEAKTIINPSESDVRISNDIKSLTKAFLDNLYYLQGCTIINASLNDLYMALSYTVRDRMLASWSSNIKDIIESNINSDIKIVSYLSAEFLPGPHLLNNLVCLGIKENMKEALQGLAIDINELVNYEEEPGLGNGGLGRLASCFLDSLTSLGIHGVGYGIRYEFGIFDQLIRQGAQVEITDKWLKYGNPWEIAKPDLSQKVGLGGNTEFYTDTKGIGRMRWIPSREVLGIPYDTPIIGYLNGKSNTMRLWKAEAVESFDFQDFNLGDYYAAVEEKVSSETITKVLYPNDETEGGKKLRLIQQYFFVSCSLRDMLRIHSFLESDIETFPHRFAVQMNDTHPSIAVAELMRLLVDEYFVDWDRAWAITRNSLAYTNHTLLPEALERWRLELFQNLLPRHMEIIYEINRRFLLEVEVINPGDSELMSRLSIIDELGDRFVRMAHLACVGSHKINGVAALHTELLKKSVLYDFHKIWPEKFENVTNGVTPRRWIAVSNPRLTDLIGKYIGSDWLKNYQHSVHQLEKFASDKDFQRQWAEVKYQNKLDLVDWIKTNACIDVNPHSLFDIQVKRIHEYKRQHLNILYVIHLYNQLRQNPDLNVPERTVLFGGKAAPGYFLAKLIIKLINSVGRVINNDTSIKGKLKIVYLPNFNVQTGHLVYPAADLSEQISLAGKEASGTGNMKFSMNGALTIGTLDGANVEIREEVGDENFFLFGLNTPEVNEVKLNGYHPLSYYEKMPDLKLVIDQIADGMFSNGDTVLFRPLVDNLMYYDPYLLFADFEDYIACQQRVGQLYLNQGQWIQKSILNVARMGKFSSDRSITEYADKIWQVKI